ncbi:ATP-dependent DNA helicase RecQ [Limosilactobacillus sp. STM2_1]|uniref:ATP-dependent DNA helicase RecQ n=1 Tax=Limosilactobacillus rudii TaxID=2759755 RepID=A0A7W3UK17_9LACO|nr:ATP-dependent DNA helicase RecQ [Limosilactobacillus rudii]MBB1079086.1 ATP-dependent DNA helicase RecQ [Limosilactobacillus rudii]MBB1097039.1 ATP-dependent DNA helicase RecQ [Limosilactobacillus rudii]MCD7134007.1 ATP-dependent DNA helicase [Limosilactobacillus rudii]
MKSRQELLRILKKQFGFNSFRPGQEETIIKLLAGEDVLTVLPTGAGKSLLYQLPAYLLTGTVIIVSPLISLMQDQVDRLHRQGEKRVVMLNSQLVGAERTAVLKRLQSFKFVFTSPEMLDNDNVLTAFNNVDVAMLVIDEAHCISQWGPDFRPEYLLLKDVRQQLGKPTTLMLTATATPRIRQDIQAKMGINDAQQIVESVDRPNIFLAVQKVYRQQEKDEELLRLVQKFKGPGIIYFASRKMASQMAEWLAERTGLNIAAYHAGITAIDRFQIQRQFMANELQVICATSAFGMGIDKNDVRFVIHYHLPNNLENYLQEIGRAGRDGKQSLAVLLYADGDEMIQRQLTSIDIPPVELLQQIKEHRLSSVVLGEQAELFNFYLAHHSSPEQIVSIFKHRKYQMEQELQEMLGYINNRGCRRKYLLTYFGEQLSTNKENCCDFDKEEWQTEIDLPASKLVTKPKKLDWQEQLKLLLNIDEN